MKKRILASILALLMITVLVTGCGGKKTGTGVVDIELAKEIEALDGDLCSKEPITLTIHLFNGTPFDDEKWTMYHEAARLTNITLTGTIAQSQAEAAQAFNMMLLEDTLPDIIYSSTTNLNDAGVKEKALLNIRDYVTNPDIMPNLAAIYAEHPDYLIAITAEDGGVYMCPKLREAGPTQAWYTRADWMEKLGLEDPKTFDEFVNVMDKIRNGDPNGNGKKDEVPYFGNYKDLFYFFGLNGDRYWDLDEATGEMYTPMLTENYKTALIYLADWYKKGYIDQEIFTRKNPRGTLWGQNLGAMTFGWFSSTMSYNEQIKNIPGFHVSVMMPPSNIHGDPGYCHSPGTIVQKTGWGISVDNKYPTETLKFFDFFYSEKGSLLNAMGVEGRDFTYVNGEPKYTDLALNYEGGAPTYVRDIGCVDIGYYMRQKWLVSGMTEEAAAGLNRYINEIETCELLPPYNFTADEQQVIDTEWVACQTKIDEYMQQAIYGTVDVNATWDSYVAQIKGLGIDKVAKAHTSAYKRYAEAVAAVAK